MKVSTVEKINKFRNIRLACIFVFALILGIVFLYFSIRSAVRGIPDNYVETNAKIVQIKEELSPVYDASDGLTSDDYDHYVFVEYSYNGKTYSDREYGKYDSSMKEGDTVLLYLDPDNPDEFMYDPSGNYVFIIVGAVVTLIGAGGIGYLICNKKKEKE